jgi:hypothetical protein
MPAAVNPIDTLLTDPTGRIAGLEWETRSPAMGHIAYPSGQGTKSAGETRDDGPRIGQAASIPLIQHMVARVREDGRSSGLPAMPK